MEAMHATSRVPRAVRALSLVAALAAAAAAGSADFKQVRRHPDPENCGERTENVGGRQIRSPNAGVYERSCEAASVGAGSRNRDARCGDWVFVRCHADPVPARLQR
jgi:hypothetical protein